MTDTPKAPATPAAPRTAPNVDEMLDSMLGKQAEATETPVKKVEAAPVQPEPPKLSWRDTVLDGDDVPQNFRGKTVNDLVEWNQKTQESARRFQSEKDRLAAELQNTRTQLTAQQAAQQAVREMLRGGDDTPKEDPRYEQLNELMFADPKAFRELYDTLQTERTQKLLAEERTRLKQEIRQETLTERNQEIGRWAFEEARRSLHGRGVSDDMLTPNRITALYAALTRPSAPNAPNEYYDQGGPQSPAVIFQAWGDLFGFPQTHTEPSPPPSAPPATQIIATPPGGARPAAAVPPAPITAKPISRELAALFESAAEEMGKPKDRLLKRAQGAA